MKTTSVGGPVAAALAAPALALALTLVGYGQTVGRARVTEFPIAYPENAHATRGRGCHASGEHASTALGSTHEITFDHRRGRGHLWISGQNYDTLVRVGPDGRMGYRTLPQGSGPHGIEFDAAGLLWVTLEFKGRVQALRQRGDDIADYEVVHDYDVRLDCRGCPDKINTHPHGLGVGPDGKTVWFTGKGTGTVGKITPGGEVEHFALPTVGSVPIYIKAGPDGNMWVTELVGNKIARVTPEGQVTELNIPTRNSRPIAIVPGPDGRMWFTEEAGNKVGRVDTGCVAEGVRAKRANLDDCVTEFAVPKRQANVILAGLAFDKEHNLWLQQYVDHFNPSPAGRDHIVKIDKALLRAKAPALPARYFTFYPVPTRDTVMHRIIEGPDGNVWFTELNANKVGRLTAAPERRPKSAAALYRDAPRRSDRGVRSSVHRRQAASVTRF